MHIKPKTLEKHLTSFNGLRTESGIFDSKLRKQVTPQYFHVAMALGFIKKTGNRTYKLNVAQFQPFHIRQIIEKHCKDSDGYRKTKTIRKNERMPKIKNELKSEAIFKPKQTKYKTISIFWGLWKKKIPVA